MTDQTFRQLLLDADATAYFPATTRDLANTVRNRLRRRRTTQLGAASIVLCAMLALLPLLRIKPTPPPSTAALKNPDELSLIRLQANSQAATVNRLMTYQRTVTLRNTTARKSQIGAPLDRIQRQR